LLTRWKISRRRAYELITAAEVGKGLCANGAQIPANERLRVWEEATADGNGDGDQLSAAELRDIISRLSPEGQRQRVADTRNYCFPFPHATSQTVPVHTAHWKKLGGAPCTWIRFFLSVNESQWRLPCPRS
jgi:hypothetical protein